MRGRLLRIALSLVSAQVTALFLSLCLCCLTASSLRVAPAMIYDGQVYAAYIWAAGAWLVAASIPLTTQLFTRKLFLIVAAIQASVAVGGFAANEVHREQPQDRWWLGIFFIVLFLIVASMGSAWLYLKMLGRITEWLKERTRHRMEDAG